MRTEKNVLYSGREMKIGLIDVDGHNFPNIPLMKISAYHKKRGDAVKWYEPLLDAFEEPYDIVYASKVFAFTPDIDYPINGAKVVKGGSGICRRINQRNPAHMPVRCKRKRKRGQSW